MTTPVDIVNAALTRTGNDPIASFEEGGAQAVVAQQNYDFIVENELTAHPWRFAKTVRTLSQLAGSAPLPWHGMYQMPSDVLSITRVESNGAPVNYERKSDKILAAATGDVVVTFTYRPDEALWPGTFREAITMRLEAVFLRALGERYEEAKARDAMAADQLQMARLTDTKQRTPTNPRRPSVLRARAGVVDRVTVIG